MTECAVRTEPDARIPRIVIPEYETYPRVVLLDDKLIVFRCDQYVSAFPRCVARTPSGERCGANLPTCGRVTVQIVGTDATVEASTSPLPKCFIRQRCHKHVHGGGEDVIPPA